MRVNKTQIKKVAAEKGFSVKFDDKKEVIEIKPKDKSDDLLEKFAELMSQNQAIMSEIGSKDETLMVKLTELLIQNNRILSRVTEEVALFKEMKPGTTENVISMPKQIDEWEVIPERNDSGFAIKYTLRAV